MPPFDDRLTRMARKTWLLVCFGGMLLLASSLSARAQAPVTIAEALPRNTLTLVSIPDLPEFVERFKRTDLGTLATDPSTKPFFKSLGGQLEEKVLGGFQRIVTIEDLKGVRSGEIGHAILLSEGRSASLLIIDAHEHLDQAKQLLDRVAQNLLAQKADEEEVLRLGEATVRCFKLKAAPGEIKRPQVQIVLYRGWIVVSNDVSRNHEAILTVIQGLDGAYRNNSLALQPEFRQVVDRILEGADEGPLDLAWFVRPFELAEALKAHKAVPGNVFDWLDSLANTGMNAIQGVGGDIRLDVAEFDLKFQTFVVVNPEVDPRGILPGSAKLLSFGTGGEARPIEISRYMNAEVATVLAGHWNMPEVFRGVEATSDHKVGAGNMRRVIDEIRTEVGVDLDALIGSVGPGFTFSTEVVTPLAPESEKLLVALTIGDQEGVRQHLPGHLENEFFRPVELVIGGRKFNAWEYEEAEPDDFPPIDNRPGTTPAVQQEPPVFRAVAIEESEILLASDLEHLKRVLERSSYIGDDQQLMSMMSRLSEDCGGSPLLMRFGRPDRVFRLTYELMRAGELPASDTFVEKALRMIDGTEVGARRESQVDASQLPQDYEQVVAPRLNPTGWVLTAERGGWYIVGGVAKSKE